MKTQITLTMEEFYGLMAKYLEGRVKTGGIECACGMLTSGSREDLQRHIKHIFHWGLDDE